MEAYPSNNAPKQPQNGSEPASKPQEADMGKLVYQMGSVIARGQRCVIKSGFEKMSGLKVAVKITRSEVVDCSTLIPREVQAMELLDHPDCIAHYKVYYDNDRTFHTMELLHGGTVMDRILETRGISEEDAGSITEHILNALQYLHSENMVHRNLDPTHIYFVSSDPVSPDFNRVKLGGFSLLKTPDNSLPETKRGGDAFYTAPELIDYYGNECGPAADMWSVGAILYIMLCAFPPFVYNTPKELAEKVKRAGFHFPSPFWDVISDLAKDFVRRLLTANPQKRSTAEACTSHPWMLAVKEVLSDKPPAKFRAELLLRRLHIFKDMDPRCQSTIADFLNLVQVPSGDMIIRQGVAPDSMFFVNAGSAQTLVNGEEVDLVTTGGFFGEAAILITGKHVADVRAVGTRWRNSRHGVRPKDVTELFQLKKHDLETIILSFPALKSRLLAVGAAYVLRVQRARQSLMFHPDLEPIPADHMPDGQPLNGPANGHHRRASFQLDTLPIPHEQTKDGQAELKQKLQQAEAKLAAVEKSQESKTCVVS